MNLLPSRKTIAQWPNWVVAANRSCLVAQGGLKRPPWPWGRSSGIRLDSQSVVYRDPELLLASKVAFGCLDGDVAE